MKIHVKKKLVRLMWKLAAKGGKINTAEGHFVNRSGIADNSMRRDYSPQSQG